MKETIERFPLIIAIGAIGAMLILAVAPAQAQAPHVHTPGEPRITNSDHHFLRDLADHNEAMVHLAHSAMQMKHAHAGGTDVAGAADVAQDARKTELIAMLRKLFGDKRDPVAPVALKQEADSIMRLESEAFEIAWRDFTLRHHRAAIAMIDRAKPRRAEVRTLARRLRAQYVKEMESARAQPVKH